jgi:hypothetical protein
MSSLIKIFSSHLQSAHLKSHGFQKRYETFSRIHPKFSEHFHLHPATSNSPGSPWKFHLIVGIGFPDIPSKQKGQLAGTHASKTHLTIETTLRYPDDNDSGKLRAETARLAEIILEQSAYLQRRHETLRHSYDRGISHNGFPADPAFDSTPD